MVISYYDDAGAGDDGDDDEDDDADDDGVVNMVALRHQHENKFPD